jgi:hypothetical protein
VSEHRAFKAAHVYPVRVDGAGGAWYSLWGDRRDDQLMPLTRDSRVLATRSLARLKHLTEEAAEQFPHLAYGTRRRTLRRALRQARSGDVARLSPLTVLRDPAAHTGHKGGGPLLFALDSIRDLVESTGQDLEEIKVCRELWARIWDGPELPAEAEITGQRELFEPALREARLVLERVEQNIIWR